MGDFWYGDLRLEDANIGGTATRIAGSSQVIARVEASGKAKRVHKASRGPCVVEEAAVVCEAGHVRAGEGVPRIHPIMSAEFVFRGDGSGEASITVVGIASLYSLPPGVELAES